MERLTSEDIGKASFDTWELCGLDHECKRDCWKPTPCKIPIDGAGIQRNFLSLLSEKSEKADMTEKYTYRPIREKIVSD